jgi:hypothetical protein
MYYIHYVRIIFYSKYLVSITRYSTLPWHWTGRQGWTSQRQKNLRNELSQWTQGYCTIYPTRNALLRNATSEQSQLRDLWEKNLEAMCKCEERMKLPSKVSINSKRLHCTTQLILSHRYTNLHFRIANKYDE